MASLQMPKSVHKAGIGIYRLFTEGFSIMNFCTCRACKVMRSNWSAFFFPAVLQSMCPRLLYIAGFRTGFFLLEGRNFSGDNKSMYVKQTVCKVCPLGGGGGGGSGGVPPRKCLKTRRLNLVGFGSYLTTQHLCSKSQHL